MKKFIINPDYLNQMKSFHTFGADHMRSIIVEINDLGNELAAKFEADSGLKCQFREFDSSVNFVLSSFQFTFDENISLYCSPDRGIKFDFPEAGADSWILYTYAGEIAKNYLYHRMLEMMNPIFKLITEFNDHYQIVIVQHRWFMNHIERILRNFDSVDSESFPEAFVLMNKERFEASIFGSIYSSRKEASKFYQSFFPQLDDFRKVMIAYSPF